MGLGKTLEVISLIDSLPRDRSYLIVAPTSLIFNWQMEFEKFAKGKKLRLAKIPFDKLPEILINQAEAMVFNPMGFNLILNKEQFKKILG